VAVGGTRWSRHGVVLVVAMALLATACGARLTPSQIAALDAQGGNGNGGGTGSGSSAATTAAAGGGSSSGASGSAAGAGGTGAVAATAVRGAQATSASAGVATPGLGVANSVCAGPASGPGVSASEIDVGNVSTLTGPVPGLFLGAIHGMNAFAAYLNSVGGICGRKLVVKAADDDFSSSGNASATQSLVNNVFAMVGSLSAFDDGGASVLQSSGIPDAGEALTSQRFDIPNNFSPQPQPLGINLAPYIYLKQSRFADASQHFATLMENAPAGIAFGNAQKSGLESIGYKFVYTDSNVEPTQTDFSADAEAMKSAGAQGLIFNAVGPLYADVAKAMQNAGLTMPFATYNTNTYDPVFIPDAGSAANGAVLVQYLAMYQGEDAGSIPTVALFDKWYRALYNATPDEFAAWGWLSGMLFVDGLNAGGGITRTNLLNGLRSVTSFDGGGVAAQDDPAGKKPPACYLIVDVVDEKYVRDPADPPSGFDCTDAPNFYYANG